MAILRVLTGTAAIAETSPQPVEERIGLSKEGVRDLVFGDRYELA
jgi:hypothetical protein